MGRTHPIAQADMLATGKINFRLVYPGRMLLLSKDRSRIEPGSLSDCMSWLFVTAYKKIDSQSSGTRQYPFNLKLLHLVKSHG